MLNSMPPRLYRFQSLDGPYREWAHQTILESVLYFACPLSYNDPFEACFTLSMKGDLSDYRLFAEEAVQKGHIPRDVLSEQFVRGLAADFDLLAPTFPASLRDEMRRTIAVCCLTESNDDILMWGHYANGHRGICFEFAPSKAPEFFKDAYRMTYSAQYPTVDYFHMNDEERARSVFLTKSAHWTYEKEWRILDVNSGAGVRTFPAAALTGLILGCEASASDEAQVRSWAQARSAPLSVTRTVKADHEFAVAVPSEQSGAP